MEEGGGQDVGAALALLSSPAPSTAALRHAEQVILSAVAAHPCGAVEWALMGEGGFQPGWTVVSAAVRHVAKQARHAGLAAAVRHVAVASGGAEVVEGDEATAAVGTALAELTGVWAHLHAWMAGGGLDAAWTHSHHRVTAWVASLFQAAAVVGCHARLGHEMAALLSTSPAACIAVARAIQEVCDNVRCGGGGGRSACYADADRESPLTGLERSTVVRALAGDGLCAAVWMPPLSRVFHAVADRQDKATCWTAAVDAARGCWRGDGEGWTVAGVAAIPALADCLHVRLQATAPAHDGASGQTSEADTVLASFLGGCAHMLAWCCRASGGVVGEEEVPRGAGVAALLPTVLDAVLRLSPAPPLDPLVHGAWCSRLCGWWAAALDACVEACVGDGDAARWQAAATVAAHASVWVRFVMPTLLRRLQVVWSTATARSAVVVGEGGGHGCDASTTLFTTLPPLLEALARLLHARNEAMRTSSLSAWSAVLSTALPSQATGHDGSGGVDSAGGAALRDMVASIMQPHATRLMQLCVPPMLNSGDSEAGGADTSDTAWFPGAVVSINAPVNAAGKGGDTDTEWIAAVGGDGGMDEEEMDEVGGDVMARSKYAVALAGRVARAWVACAPTSAVSVCAHTIAWVVEGAGCGGMPMPHAHPACRYLDALSTWAPAFCQAAERDVAVLAALTAACEPLLSAVDGGSHHAHVNRLLASCHPVLRDRGDTVLSMVAAALDTIEQAYAPAAAADVTGEALLGRATSVRLACHTLHLLCVHASTTLAPLLQPLIERVGGVVTTLTSSAGRVGGVVDEVVSGLFAVAAALDEEGHAHFVEHVAHGMVTQYQQAVAGWNEAWTAAVTDVDGAVTHLPAVVAGQAALMAAVNTLTTVTRRSGGASTSGRPFGALWPQVVVASASYLTVTWRAYTPAIISATSQKPLTHLGAVVVNALASCPADTFEAWVAGAGGPACLDAVMDGVPTTLWRAVAAVGEPLSLVRVPHDVGVERGVASGSAAGRVDDGGAVATTVYALLTTLHTSVMGKVAGLWVQGMQSMATSSPALHTMLVPEWIPTPPDHACAHVMVPYLRDCVGALLRAAGGPSADAAWAHALYQVAAHAIAQVLSLPQVLGAPSAPLLTDSEGGCWATTLMPWTGLPPMAWDGDMDGWRAAGRGAQAAALAQCWQCMASMVASPRVMPLRSMDDGPEEATAAVAAILSHVPPLLHRCTAHVSDVWSVTFASSTRVLTSLLQRAWQRYQASGRQRGAAEALLSVVSLAAAAVPPTMHVALLHAGRRVPAMRAATTLLSQCLSCLPVGGDVDGLGCVEAMVPWSRAELEGLMVGSDRDRRRACGNRIESALMAQCDDGAEDEGHAKRRQGQARLQGRVAVMHQTGEGEWGQEAGGEWAMGDGEAEVGPVARLALSTLFDEEDEDDGHAEGAMWDD